MQTVIVELRVQVDTDDEVLPQDVAIAVRSELATHYSNTAIKSAKVKGKPGRPTGWRKPAQSIAEPTPGTK